MGDRGEKNKRTTADKVTRGLYIVDQIGAFFEGDTAEGLTELLKRTLGKKAGWGRPTRPEDNLSRETFQADVRRSGCENLPRWLFPAVVRQDKDLRAFADTKVGGAEQTRTKNSAIKCKLDSGCLVSGEEEIEEWG